MFLVLQGTMTHQCLMAGLLKSLKPSTCALSSGHWKLKHTIKNLGIIQFNLMTQFLLFTFIRNAPGLFESFGFLGVKPAFIAFTLFSAVSAPINEVRLWQLDCRVHEQSLVTVDQEILLALRLI